MWILGCKFLMYWGGELFLEELTTPPHVDLRVQVPHVLGWRALLGRAHHPRVEDRDAKAESNCCQEKGGIHLKLRGGELS